jgi:hypothetical protein
MLMKGMSPAILGVHCDGAPRDESNNPQGSGLPDTMKQEELERYNRYHIIVTGVGCLTQFIKEPVILEIASEPAEDVYNIISSQVMEKHVGLLEEIPSCRAVEFDWWDLHTGVIAKKKEWRYMIRVCESDYYEPRRNLREVIRIQSQVYSPINFGW